MDAITKLIRFHESGGHEGDGSDATLAAARTELQTFSLKCGKYEIRQGPDGILICRDPSDGIEFVITEVNIGAFMFAGMMLLGIDVGKTPATTLSDPPAQNEPHDLGCICPVCGIQPAR